ERLEMVKAAARGDAGTRIARWSGRWVATVERWLARFLEGGVDALADAPPAGRPVHAEAAYLAALETALQTPPPSSWACSSTSGPPSACPPTWSSRPACTSP